MKTQYDVIIIGSGPAGALAAERLVKKGLDIAILDIGEVQKNYSIPDSTYSELFNKDSNQSSYFLGPNLEGVSKSNQRVGSQLTPPRQYMVKDSNVLFPYHSDNFFPLLATNKGGLGSGWGEACFTFDRKELDLAHLHPDEIAPYYQKVADLIGISGDLHSKEFSHYFPFLKNIQPPLEIDSNAQTITKAYQNKKASSLKILKSCLAVLSEDKEGRKASEYKDMDFYADNGKSCFRPQHLIEKLSLFKNFTYIGGYKALSFKENPSEKIQKVAIEAENLNLKSLETFTAKSIILAAGAINSARIAHQSSGLNENEVPLLSNAYTYVPCLNWKNLGKKTSDKRHSLAQLFGFYEGGKIEERSTLQFYSYRSLLLFKLVKEFPLPAWLGLLFARTIVNCLSIVGIHHSDRIKSTSKIIFKNRSLTFNFDYLKEQKKQNKKNESGIKKQLIKLGLIPLGSADTGTAGSIHYGGTLSPTHGTLNTLPNFTLKNFKNVFVGDSSCFNFLPAKGLTFTIMAHAMRVADKVFEHIHES